MPNGDDWLGPGEWSLLAAPLREIDSLITAFAETHGAEISVGGSLAGLPSRAVQAGEMPVRVLEVRPNPALHDPAYDIWIRATIPGDWNPREKRRRIAERVAAEDLAATFTEVAEEGWRELAGWAVNDDFQPRW